MSDDKPTIKEIEEAIPDERKNLSFGGPDEDILDVMDRWEDKEIDDTEDSDE